MKRVSTPYEIIISGDVENFRSIEGVVLVDTPEDADNGRLAKLRNNAGEKAQYDILVFVDDDLVFDKNWGRRICEYTSEWDILGHRVLLPNGGRYWDRATYNPHSLIDYDAENYPGTLYQSGAFWIIKKRVYDIEKWDSSIAYDPDTSSGLPLAARGRGAINEDIEYSFRLQNRGFTISFDKENLIWHDDDQYVEDNSTKRVITLSDAKREGVPTPPIKRDFLELKASLLKTDIKDFLKKYIGRKIKYIPNPGHAGDSLIALGTLSVFQELNLDFEICNHTDIFNNDLLFYGGGGNLVGTYEEARNFLHNNGKNNEIIILPHTVKSEDETILNLGDNVKIICRERKSYEYVLNLTRHPENVFLSDDMAFHIHGLEKYKTDGTGVCNAFGNEQERTSIILPEDNRDISHEYMFEWPLNTSTLEGIKRSSHHFLSYLSRFETINTNRLHVAIAGCLLNKKINLYPNSYWKVDEVYRYSILERYPNVNFINQREGKINEIINS